jgi:two-component system response regulator MtrA
MLCDREVEMSIIVVADDDADIRELVVYRLERDGHDVTAVGDGIAAVEELRQQPADLAILDVMMPGMSGIDATRAIRQDPSLADVRIILLTARTREADLEIGYLAGADDYVAKPFSPRELSLRVSAVLARR